MIEIYAGNESDTTYDESILELSNERDILVQQIKLLLDTQSGEVINDSNFGASLEDYLFEFKLNESQLKKKLESQIRAYCDLGSFDLDISVKFYKGSIRDAAEIDIFLNGNKTMGMFIK